MASRTSTPRPGRRARPSCAAVTPTSSSERGHACAGSANPPSRLRGVLSPRQELLLRKVVEAYTETGLPVGSKTLASDPEIEAGSSTIRHELAMLEDQGLLAHPHTSAGRVPTDAGHRWYVDQLTWTRQAG